MRSFQILFEFESDVQIRFDSKLTADSKILNRRACHICRRTINNTHRSTTNSNRFGIATGIYYPPFASIAKGEVFVLLYVFLFVFYPPFASIAKGEVFVLLYVFLYFCMYVRSTISRQPAGRFTPKFACRRTLVPDVSSPLLGVGGPRRAKKGANEIFVTMGVNGEFLHFGGF